MSRGPSGLPRLHIPDSTSSSSHSQTHPSLPFTPQSSVHQRFPQTAGPFHQRFGSITIPLSSAGGAGGGLATARGFPSEAGWGVQSQIGGGTPMSATGSSFPLPSPGGHHQHQMSMGGGNPLAARFGRLRGGHGRTQSIGPPPKAALGGAGVYTSAAKAASSTTSELPPGTPTLDASAPPPPPTKKKKAVVVKLPHTGQADNENETLQLWSRVAFSLDGDDVAREEQTLEPEMVSREVSPEEGPAGELLSLDVYLPGKRFWKVMQEERIQARLAELGVAQEQQMFGSTSSSSSSSPLPPPSNHLSPFGSAHPVAHTPSLFSSSAGGLSPALNLSPAPSSDPALSPVNAYTHLSPSPKLDRTRTLPPHLTPPQLAAHNPYFPRLVEPQSRLLQNVNATAFVPRLNPTQAPFVPRPLAPPFVPQQLQQSSSPFRQDPLVVFGNESVSEDTEGEENEAAEEEEEGERRLNNERWEEEGDEDLVAEVGPGVWSGGEETPGFPTAKGTGVGPQEAKVGEAGQGEEEVRVGDVAGFGEEEEEEEEEEGGEARRREFGLEAAAKSEEETQRMNVDERDAWQDQKESEESMSDAEYSNPSDEDRHRARRAARRDRASTFGAARRRSTAEIISNPSDEEDSEDEFSPHQQPLKQQQQQHKRQISHATTVGAGSGTGSVSPALNSPAPYLNPLVRPFQSGVPSASSPPSYDPARRAFDPSSLRRTSNPSVFDTANSSWAYFTADEGSPRINPLPVPVSLRGRPTFNPAAPEFRPIQPLQRLHTQQRSSIESAQAFTFSAPLPAGASSRVRSSLRGSIDRPIPTPPLPAVFDTLTQEEEERMQQGRLKRVKQDSDGLVNGSNVASRRAVHSPHTSPERPLQVLAGGDIDRLTTFKMPVGMVVPVTLSPEVKLKTFRMPLAPSSYSPSPTKSMFLGLTLTDGLAPPIKAPSPVEGHKDEQTASALLPPPLASANSFTSSTGNGERFKRSPIPMFSSPPISTRLPGTLEHNTRASVKSKLESRDLTSNAFFHRHDNLTDDSIGQMPAISQQQGKSSALHGQTLDEIWEVELDQSPLGGGERGGGGRSQTMTGTGNARSSSDVLPLGDVVSAAASLLSSSLSGPILIDDLVRRIQLLLDDKLNSLRTSDVTGGFVHLSSLHPDAEDVLVARIVGTLVEAQKGVEEGRRRENGVTGVDVEMVKGAVEEGYRAVCERVEGSVVEALRNLDLPTSMFSSLDAQALELLQSQMKSNAELLHQVLTRLQETSTKLDDRPSSTDSPPPVTLVDDLLSYLLPAVEASKVNPSAFIDSLLAALSPVFKAQRTLVEEKHIEPDQIVALLLPHFESLKPHPFDQDALTSKLNQTVSESVARALSHKMDLLLDASKPPPPLDTKALVDAFVVALPPPPPPDSQREPIDFSPLQSKLEFILLQLSQAADERTTLAQHMTSPSPVALQTEVAELQSALRDAKSASDHSGERSKAVEKERARLTSELEVARKDELGRLKEKAEMEVVRVRKEYEMEELKEKLKRSEEERDASLAREKIFKRENEDRARENSKLKLKVQVMDNELDQARKAIGINARTSSQFQSTTTNQLETLTKTIAAAESKQKEELVALREQVKKLTAETSSSEKRLRLAEEKLTSQTRAASAAAASAKQAQAGLSQELDRRVREVEGTREDLSVMRERVESIQNEVMGLRTALQQNEGRLTASTDSERSLRSNLREAEQTVQSLRLDLQRRESSRTPTAGLPSSSSNPAWSLGYNPQQQQRQHSYASSTASSNGRSPSEVVHRLQQQILTPPASTFRPSLPPPAANSYFSTPTRAPSEYGKGASESMHAPIPMQHSSSYPAAGGRGPSATPVQRVGTVRPPEESDDGWWGAE